jgi:hypothetical protein
MQKIKVLLVLAVLAVAIMAGWQIAAAELAKVNFQEDLRDMASQAGTHIGVVAPSSEERVTQTIIRKAHDHGIELTPQQITVRRTQNGELSTWYLAADYAVPIKLGIFSFNMHFIPSSQRSGI